MVPQKYPHTGGQRKTHSLTKTLQASASVLELGKFVLFVQKLFLFVFFFSTIQGMDEKQHCHTHDGSCRDFHHHRRSVFRWNRLDERFSPTHQPAVSFGVKLFGSADLHFEAVLGSDRKNKFTLPHPISGHGNW